MPNILLTTADGLATITFDREGSSANLFDQETLVELGAVLDRIKEDRGIKGVVIRSAKPSIFIAGADLKVLSAVKGEALEKLISLGQETFNRLEDLRIPTVAAIHGACVGGGLELALACDWRIASDSKKTKIGLPETQLGILPAWGGSTRLPKLVGLPIALPLILGGKLLGAKAAKHKGLVDVVVPAENLEVFAAQWIGKGKRVPLRRRFIHNPVSVSLIRKNAKGDLETKSRGHYPGPVEALDVVVDSVLRPRPVSLKAERDAILRLAEKPQTAQLMRLFSLQEKAKKARYVQAEARKVDRVMVVGSGVMGSGIAYWLSTRGFTVLLFDVSSEAIAKGLGRIRELYGEAVSRRVLTPLEAARGLDRIHVCTEGVPLERVDLIIEAATEEMSLKKRIFADLSARAPADTLLATNTSALPIHELAEVVVNPERLLGLHFFNPVHRMQLVEVVRTSFTSNETLATGVEFVRAIGKLPVIVKDSPGFLVNRILVPYLVEAARLFERGGDPKAIDCAMLDFGMPMGPLRLLDEVGLDVAVHVAKTLSAAFPDRMTVPRIAEELVGKGQLGRKSGKGFYDYSGGTIRPNPDAMTLRPTNEAIPEDILNHLAGLMTEEAGRCLDEGVVESADQLDLAMVMGSGYAPFRGGPMQYRKEES
jgi:3-hydroxyacyl-CoA dehydrogenase/enoyl-CoA hydratase/3-hydroxybutyryl-CoA epimerase